MTANAVEFHEIGIVTDPCKAFGEFTLLDVARRAATVTTTEDSRLMRLGRDALAAYLERAAQVGVALLWSLARFVSRRDRAGGHEDPLGSGRRAIGGEEDDPR